MIIKTIASGSSGNCYLIDDGESKILIECGLPIDEIQKGVDFTLSEIEGCLVSHEHMDHAKSVYSLISLGTPIYTSQGTAQALSISGYMVRTMEPLKRYIVGGYEVLPFPTQHDCAEPFGFLIKSKTTGESIMFATDTYYIKYRFANVDYYMIEANYLEEYLEYYEEHKPDVVKRLFGSHMSCERAIQFLQAQDLTKTKAIYILHVSSERGDIEIIRSKVARATGKMIIMAGVDD